MYQLSRATRNLSPKLRQMSRHFSNQSFNNENPSLSPELARKVVSLKCPSTPKGGVCNVFLVGTKHGFTESRNLVRAVISSLKPQAVFLELCPGRIDFLKSEPKVPTVREIIEMWKRKMTLYQIYVTYRNAKAVEDCEFRVGYQEATKYGGKVFLGDRAIHITSRRRWEVPMLIQLPSLSMIVLVISRTLRALKMRVNALDHDVDEIDKLAQQFTKEDPAHFEVLLHERDKYMSSELMKVASEHNSVVAIVGQLHLPGMKRNLEHSIQVSNLGGLSTLKQKCSLGMWVDNTSPSAPPPGDVYPPSFVISWPFIFLVLATITLTIYIVMMEIKVYLGTSEEVKDVATSSVPNTVVNAAITEKSMPIVEPTTKPHASILEGQQRELLKWILEEKRKIKPRDAKEKKLIDEEKAILKQWIRSKSIPTL